MEKDVVFLKDTQSADVGDRVPRRKEKIYTVLHSAVYEPDKG